MPDQATVEQVQGLARKGIDRALEQARTGFSVEKFAEHPDGFFHAQVRVDGKSFYLHARFGSWMAPGKLASGKEVMKEIEALVLGTSAAGRGKEIKEVLQTKVHRLRKAARLAQERAEGKDSSDIVTDPAEPGESADAAGGGEEVV